MSPICSAGNDASNNPNMQRMPDAHPALPQCISDIPDRKTHVYVGVNESLNQTLSAGAGRRFFSHSRVLWPNWIGCFGFGTTPQTGGRHDSNTSILRTSGQYLAAA